MQELRNYEKIEEQFKVSKNLVDFLIDKNAKNTVVYFKNLDLVSVKTPTELLTKLASFYGKAPEVFGEVSELQTRLDHGDTLDDDEESRVEEYNVAELQRSLRKSLRGKNSGSQRLLVEALKNQSHRRMSKFVEQQPNTPGNHSRRSHGVTSLHAPAMKPVPSSKKGSRQDMGKESQSNRSGASKKKISKSPIATDSKESPGKPSKKAVSKMTKPDSKIPKPVSQFESPLPDSNKRTLAPMAGAKGEALAKLGKSFQSISHKGGNSPREKTKDVHKLKDIHKLNIVKDKLLLATSGVLPGNDDDVTKIDGDASDEENERAYNIDKEEKEDSLGEREVDTPLQVEVKIPKKKERKKSEANKLGANGENADMRSEYPESKVGKVGKSGAKKQKLAEVKKIAEATGDSKGELGSDSDKSARSGAFLDRQPAEGASIAQKSKLQNLESNKTSQSPSVVSPGRDQPASHGDSNHPPAITIPKSNAIIKIPKIDIEDNPTPDETHQSHKDMSSESDQKSLSPLQTKRANLAAKKPAKILPRKYLKYESKTDLLPGMGNPPNPDESQLLDFCQMLNGSCVTNFKWSRIVS